MAPYLQCTQQAMRFGINLFPVVGPSEKSAAQYYDESFDLCRAAEEVGFAFVRAVEHYFFDWGGYCPDPVALLSALSRHLRRMRVVTGAVIPAFSHPVKLAAQLAQLDHLSRGRLDVGFARAFIPAEFGAFGVSMQDSRQRFEEGITAVKKLWTDENFRWEGRFHQFGPLKALLPPCYQAPHPPTYVAATTTAASFEWAGQHGHNLMAVPYVIGVPEMQKLLALYRAAWASGGHGHAAPRIQLSYQCCVAESRAEAIAEGRKYFEEHRRKQLDALSSWEGRQSDQYPGYEKIVDDVRSSSYDAHISEGKMLIGTPGEVLARLRELRTAFGDFDPCLQISFGDTPAASAMRTVRLLGDKVVSALADQPEETQRQPSPRRPK
jgi:alkanesulfonate monooxygenase SsuD/methylene tetrahydromethanopterin reductase-like flavin-dependent oxidoreductase (luciferase family)